MPNKVKDPKRQLQGAISKAKGKQFESLLDASFMHYDLIGYAAITKTPEPMRPTKPMGAGKFIAYFEKKAQPDYEGTLKGGRSIMLEAKFTSAVKMEQNRVLGAQSDYLSKHSDLGASCFIVAGFDTGNTYRIPWAVWVNMKEHFGRKYIMEADVAPYKVPFAKNGTLLVLD